ncbi:MAG: hypothetical protein IPL35_12655 [Sphingobacteriales bacterium]|nr:hypothetical protein [Sphingobacteriales bacterium]
MRHLSPSPKGKRPSSIDQLSTAKNPYSYLANFGLYLLKPAPLSVF